MTTDDQSDSEPSDEDMAEILGEEPCSIPLPTGKQRTVDVAQKAIREADGTTAETAQETAPAIIGEDRRGSDHGHALVLGGTIDSMVRPSLTQAREEDEPETVEDQLLRLPARWMRTYLRALLKAGSQAEARQCVPGGLSAASVTKAIAEYPLFAEIHKQAVDERNDRVKSATFHGATEGDDVPLVSQGAIVGSYKKRDTKAAELWAKMHGLMAADQVNVTHTGRVELADESQMAEMLRDVALLLHGQPKRIEGRVIHDNEARLDKGAKVVSESDRKDG